MNSPKVAQHLYGLMEYLRYDATFEPKMKEIVICTVSRAMENTWEYDSHAILARHHGVREQVFKAIETGNTRPLKPDERLWITFSKQTMARKIDKETFATAHKILGDKGIIETMALIGCYVMLSYVVLGLDVDIASGNPPHPTEDNPKPV